MEALITIRVDLYSMLMPLNYTANCRGGAVFGSRCISISLRGESR